MVGILDEIIALHDDGCDLYIHDASLDTTSPVDRVVFRFAEALRAIPTAQSKRDTPRPGSSAAARLLKPTPYQRSVIRGALDSGLKPKEVAKALKVPIALVKQVGQGD